jgi:transposase InsO family protein
MTKTPSVQYSKALISATSNTTFLDKVPDIETWHRHLGHCNTHTIVKMAKNGVSQGMPIDLSSLPPKCDHCVLGKQMHSSVLKIWEGIKATMCLERVYVDLCGPMAVSSQTGNLYCMNLIDDFSGYVWSIPIRSKSNTSLALQNWHKAVTVQSGETLCILVTDNGKLVSKSTEAWCQSHGIDHQCTAPYMSAQNGRAEWLHRTIQGKACSMHLACNAPGFLWDEFFLTAAYLTCLTAATTNQGHTPYKLWFRQKPSLSHLCKIGCRMFSLHTPSLSKIYPRSQPCVLIGYTPHAKAYRLWDPASSKIYNSFHVTFTEHLDAALSSFQPGTVLGTTNATSPPSWDVSGPAPTETSPAERPFSSTPFDSSFSPSDTADLPTIVDPFMIASLTYNSQNVPSQNNNNNTVITSNNNNMQSNNNISSNNTVPPQTNNTVNPSNNTVPP